MDEEQSSNLQPLLMILIVLIVAVAGYYAKGGRLPVPWHTAPPTGLVLVESAPAGKLIAGIPQDLVKIAEDAKVVESAKYRVEDSEGSSILLYAKYETSAGIPDLFGAYVTLITGDGYTIRTETKSGVSNIEGTRTTDSLSVSMYLEDLKTRAVEVRLRMLQ